MPTTVPLATLHCTCGKDFPIMAEEWIPETVWPTRVVCPWCKLGWNVQHRSGIDVVVAPYYEA